MRFEGKTIIVTGSTTGIGEAIAHRCAAEGSFIMVHGRDRQRGESVAHSLGPRAACHIDDLADPDAATRLVKATVEQFGAIDGLVNNAALTTRSHLASTDASLFDTVMAVNLRAPTLLVRAAIPHLKTSRGVVLNIGSVSMAIAEKPISWPTA